MIKFSESLSSKCTELCATSRPNVASAGIPDSDSLLKHEFSYQIQMSGVRITQSQRTDVAHRPQSSRCLPRTKQSLVNSWSNFKPTQIKKEKKQLYLLLVVLEILHIGPFILRSVLYFLLNLVIVLWGVILQDFKIQRKSM